MNNTKNCAPCAKQYPFENVYRRAAAAMDATQSKTVCIPEVLAVCLRETSCNPWFTENEPLLKENLVEMEKKSACSRTAFMNEIIFRSSTGVLTVPKFRFEQSWFYEVVRAGRWKNQSLAQKVALSCSWGIGQKEAEAIVSRDKTGEPMRCLKQFRENLDLQIMQVFIDLAEIKAMDPLNRPLMFSRYNAGSGCNHVNGYGRLVENQCQAFEQQLKKMGYRICLASTR